MSSLILLPDTFRVAKCGSPVAGKDRVAYKYRTMTIGMSLAIACANFGGNEGVAASSQYSEAVEQTEFMHDSVAYSLQRRGTKVLHLGCGPVQ